MSEQLISHIKMRAIQVLVANELGLKPERIEIAEKVIKSTEQLSDEEYNQLTVAGYKIVLDIQDKGLEQEALKLSKKYI